MKLTKKLLSVILSVAMVASSLVFVLPASAQSLVKGVYANFTGMDQSMGDYIMVNSSGVILDTSLGVTLYNDSEKDIEVTNVASPSNVFFTGFTEGMIVGAGQAQKFTVGGSTTANDVLTVTVSYKLAGNPDTTVETVSTYIYAKTEQNTTTTLRCYSASSLGKYGADCNLSLSPVATQSVTNNKSTAPVSNATIYVDGSMYTTWQDYNLQFYWDPDFDMRDNYQVHGFSAALSNNTGSFGTNSSDYIVPNESGTTSWSWDADNKVGYFVGIAGDAASMDALGVIPTAATTTIDVGFTLYGCTGGIISAVIEGKSPALKPQFKLTVYNNNKAEIRAYLNELASYGLNQGSYTTSSWNNYVTYLRAAYVQLGKNQTTAANVSNAISRLKSAFNALVRYDSVIVNHNYYTDSEGKEYTTIQTDYNMKVVDGSTFAPAVLSANQYPQYKFNRSKVVESLKVTGNAENNYLTEVNQYYWYVDTNNLETAINTAKHSGYNGTNVDKDGNPIYTDESWSAMQTALADAQKALADTNLFQVDIDEAYRTLNRANNALERLSIDTSYLDGAITWTQAMIYSEETGEMDAYYDVTEQFDILGRDWTVATIFPGTGENHKRYEQLKLDYDAAIALLNSGTYTASDITICAQKLWADISNLVVADDMGTTTLSKRIADKNIYGYYFSRRDNKSEQPGLAGLFDDITDNTTGTYRLNQDDFTEDSWLALTTALYGYNVADGKSVIDGVYKEPWTAECDPYMAVSAGCSEWVEGDYELTVPAYTMINNIYFLANQRDMDSCRDNLLTKVSELEYVIDPSEVQSLLDQAAQYTSENATSVSLAKLTVAVEKATALLDKATAEPFYGVGIPQSELDACIPELVQALNDIVDISALRATVDDYKAMADTSLYTEKSVNYFLEGIAEYEALYESNASQTEIDSAVYTVGDLVTRLHNVPVVSVIDAYSDLVSLSAVDTVKTIEGVGVSNTVDSTLLLFDLDGGEAKIVDRDDNDVPADANIGTGYKLVVSRDEQVFETYTFIIAGDVDGDAVYTVNDARLIMNHYLKPRAGVLSGIYDKAADVNADGKIDLTDSAMILVTT